MKHRVTFLPKNKTVEADAGESVLEVALRNDVPLPHACGGLGACTTCQVTVEIGAESLSEIEELEADRLERADPPATLKSRLGCQAKVLGNVTVKMAGGSKCH